MNPYSHIVVAAKLAPFVKPEDLEEYYWGAVVPDIRYLAVIQREQTHPPPRRILEFASQYPQLKSFLQGYLVHCLSDEIDLGEIFFRHFPFSLLKGKMSRQQLTILLELFYSENEKVKVHVSGAHNEVLTELGLSERTSKKFSQSINHYVASSSPESRFIDLLQILGLENDSRVEKYVKAIQGFQKNWFLKNILFLALRTAGINQEIVSKVTFLFSSVQCQ